EENLSYSRPLLPRYLSGEFSLEKISYRQEDFFRKNRLEFILGKKVVRIKPEEKSVFLEEGGQLDYGKLLLTAGSVPFQPQIEGLNLAGVFTFLCITEVNRIKKYLAENRVEDVLILGGGLIGLEATETFTRLGCRVRIVELAPALLSATFDRKASEIMANHLSGKGVKIELEDTVVSFEGTKGRVKKAFLKKGGEVPVDLAVLAIGVRPRTELAEGAGIAVERGVVTSMTMRTSRSDIFAAGDCVQTQNVLSGIKQPLPLWPEAFRQGKTAGANMVSSKSGSDQPTLEYKGGLVMNALEIMDLSTISVGITEDAAAEVLFDYQPEKKVYRKILFKNNLVIGYVFINKIERSGIYTGLIKEKIEVGSFKDKLLDDDFGLIYLPSDYQKHLVKGEGIEV
ncbi:MAG: FAD-dependent oxidoreductase, partial [Candidatus Omnitrophica bacterium]|nr:FAD-dependent oxidoreductase [Candidatus Omnitrophota bacterium]